MNKEDKISLRIAFTRDNPNKLATDNIPEYADWLESKCIEMKMSEEKIKHIILRRIPLFVFNKKGKLQTPYKSKKAFDTIIEGLTYGIYKELNKL